MLIEQTQPTTKASNSSLRRFAPALALFALCLPSLLFVWHNRDVPHFGILQDDGLYFIDGKSLAEGSDYRILSLPAQPHETRYPPLYPLYLSLAWRINPAFPANLPLALMFSWLSFPALVVLTYLWCRRQQLPPPVIWLVTALFALNPYLLFFVSNLGSETMFMAFMFGAVLLVEPDSGRTNWYWPLLAGVLAGAGYLVRTAGMVFLPAAIAYYAWKKKPRQALWFALGMLPAMAAWTLWTHAHAAPGRDVVTVAYTNYIASYIHSVGWDNIAVILWNNFSAMLESFGSLVFPQMIQGILAKFILQPLGVAMILGVIKMLRKGYGGLYAWFSGFYVALLMIWHFLPNQRYVMPLAPLLLAGLCFEMEHLATLMRTAFGHRDRSQRAVAYGFAGFLILVLAIGLGLQAYMGFSVMPEMARDDRSHAQAYGRIYQWIDKNLPADAGVLWEGDTVLYLATGHHGSSFVFLPREFIATGGEEGEALRTRTIDAYAREAHLGYVLLTKVGLHRNDEALRVAAANPNLERIHEEDGGILYRVR
jgi:hypothetical protein